VMVTRPNQRAAFLHHGEPSPSPVVMSSATPPARRWAYLYSRDNPTEALQAKMLTEDEARRIAINVARLPELRGKADTAIELSPANPDPCARTGSA
jgi:hypothetical protein